jgi:hypothetical protein
MGAWMYDSTILYLGTGWRSVVGFTFRHISPPKMAPVTSLMDHAVAYWLRLLATSRKIAGFIHDEVNFFFLIYLILPAALSPGVYSASNRNEYQKQRNNVSGE